jgi:threonine dehydratase
MAILALQATAGIEILRQHSSIVAARHQAMNSHAARPPLDAIFLPVGGGSLLAGVAAAVKQLHPAVKVIGVEPESVDVLRQSLMSGSRVTIEEPGVDGIWVPQLGEEVRCMYAPLTYTPSDTHTHTHTHTHIHMHAYAYTYYIHIQVYRLCDTLVDDVVCVSDDEIREAIRDCFEDTRALLEPAGALLTMALLTMAVLTTATVFFARARCLSPRAPSMCMCTHAYASRLESTGATSMEQHRVTGCHAYGCRRDLDRGPQEVGGAAATERRRGGASPVRGGGF